MFSWVFFYLLIFFFDYKAIVSSPSLDFFYKYCGHLHGTLLILVLHLDSASTVLQHGHQPLSLDGLCWCPPASKKEHCYQLRPGSKGSLWPWRSLCNALPPHSPACRRTAILCYLVCFTHGWLCPRCIPSSEPNEGGLEKWLYTSLWDLASVLRLCDTGSA